eukprot:81708-Chlamydomonas_euryale.AAC.1
MSDGAHVQRMAVFYRRCSTSLWCALLADLLFGTHCLPGVLCGTQFLPDLPGDIHPLPNRRSLTTLPTSGFAAPKLVGLLPYNWQIRYPEPLLVIKMRSQHARNRNQSMQQEQ